MLSCLLDLPEHMREYQLYTAFSGDVAIKLHETKTESHNSRRYVAGLTEKGYKWLMISFKMHWPPYFVI